MLSAYPRKSKSYTVYLNKYSALGIRVMVFNATFNNVSVIWGLSVLLVKETRVTEKTTNHKSLTNTVYCKTAIPNRKFNVRLISI